MIWVVGTLGGNTIMGMFDNVSDFSLRCPYCGGTKIELQTKDYDNTLSTIAIHEPGFTERETEKGKIKYPKCHACWRKKFFKEGEVAHPTTRLKQIEVTGACSGPICYCLAKMKGYADYGYVSGFGRLFRLQYQTRNGIAVAPAIITEKDSDTLEEIRKRFKARLNKEKEAKKSFDKVLERVGGEYGLAVLEWHWSCICKDFPKKKK